MLTAPASHAAAPKDSTSGNVTAAATASAGATPAPTRDADDQDGDRWLELLDWQELDRIEQSYAARNVPQQQQEQQQERQIPPPASLNPQSSATDVFAHAQVTAAVRKQQLEHALSSQQSSAQAAGARGTASACKQGPGQLLQLHAPQVASRAPASNSEVVAAQAATMAATACGMPLPLTSGPAIAPPQADKAAAGGLKYAVVCILFMLGLQLMQYGHYSMLSRLSLKLLHTLHCAHLATHSTPGTSEN